MRLNLGCGSDIRAGYVNVDFRKLPGVDQVVDLSKFPWPFEDGSADEILMLDFLEHFPYRSTPTILLECYRVLVPGGKLVIQVPDALQTTRAMVREGNYLCNFCGAEMFGDIDGLGEISNYGECECGKTDDEISEAAMQRFYGGQDYPGNFHQTAFTDRSLSHKAANAGFHATEHALETKEHLWKNWTLGMTFVKGELW